MSLSPDDIAAMLRAREKKLLERWAEGARLSADEREEIAHLLPKRGEPKPEAAAPAAPVAPVLVLEAQPAEAPAGRAGCKFPIVPGSPYEGTYDATIRTIKRWRHVGAQKQPPAMPPLDEPWRMAAWYRTHMERVVPARLLQLEEEGPPKPPTPVATAVAPVVPPAADPAPAASAPGQPKPPPPADVHASLATGYAATLARFRQAEAIAAQRYFDAIAAPDEFVRANAPALKREWNDVAGTLRSYEKDASAILTAAGNLWDAPSVIDILTGIHTTIAAGIRRMHRRMRQQHPDAHLLPPAEQDALWDAEVDALFSALANSHFTSVTAPAPAELHGVAA